MLTTYFAGLSCKGHGDLGILPNSSTFHITLGPWGVLSWFNSQFGFPYRLGRNNFHGEYSDWGYEPVKQSLYLGVFKIRPSCLGHGTTEDFCVVTVSQNVRRLSNPY